MIKTKFVFAVSMVAMMAVNVANAKIAATSYVDKGVTTATNAANAAQTSANAANTAAGKAQTSANNAQQAADNAQASADAAAASAQTANEAVALKQDKLTAGTNITISGSTISAKDTTYSTGNGTTSGLTKLYTSIGSNTDGTMTQKAITDSLGNKLDKTANAVSATKATKDGSGNTITTTYEKVANKVTSVDGDSDDVHYPTAKAVYDYAESVRSEISEGNAGALALKQDKLTAGTNITISGNTISAKDTTYSTGNGTTSGLTKLYTGTGSNTDGTMTQKAITDSLGNKLDKTANAVSATKATQDGSGNNIVNTYATKTALSEGLATKQATLTTSNIKGSGSVSVGISNGVITVSGTDNNTTYSTGNGTTSGLTKLYTSTGSNTDGTMTQKAITDSLGNKLDKTANAVSATKATQDGNGNVITSTYEKVANKVTSVDGDSDDTHYPTAKAVYDYAESVRSEISEGNASALALKQDKSTAVTHTANTAAGTATRPVYVTSGGVATAVTGMSIPSGAETNPSSWATIWVE